MVMCDWIQVAVDVGEFAEAMTAYHRLLELRHKYTDSPVSATLTCLIVQYLGKIHLMS